jgi:hypothetical protein
MGTLNDNEQRDLEVIREIKRRRLLELQKQQARRGLNTPPEVKIEIEDLRRELGVVEPIIRGDLGDDVLAALRQFGLPASLSNAIQSFESRLYDLSIKFKEQEQRSRRTEVVQWLTLMLLAVLATYLFTKGYYAAGA